jgi:iron uptake system component EfeO
MKHALVAVVLVVFAFGGVACNKTKAPAEQASTKIGGAVRVEATEFAFEPDVLYAKAGKVEFAIQNIGSAVHEFEILKGKKVLGEVEDISPGLELPLKVTLAPGTYEFACKLEDHYQRGMKGTLRVA